MVIAPTSWVLLAGAVSVWRLPVFLREALRRPPGAVYACHMMSEEPPSTPTVYLDADACPVKDVVYKVAGRYGVPLKVVANGYLRIPETHGLVAEMITVPGSPDAADDWIAERAGTGTSC